MFEISNLIGNTPIIKIKYEYNSNIKYVYTKLEYYNLTGSIKDRVAYYIIINAKKRGILKEKMPIIEATSGNTGIALAALGKYYNHPVYIFMPDWVSKERIKLMESYGANVVLISKEKGGFIKCVEESKTLAKRINGFCANQFENNDNLLAHYETTGEEILNQISEKIGGFISGVGTGGTLTGVRKRLKKQYKNIKIIAIEPDKMPIISKKDVRGNHKIEGIGDEFVPDLLDKDIIDEIILVNDEDSINMSRLLAEKLGLGVGISSGANFLGSVLAGEGLANPIVTVFPDDNKKYISTELFEKIRNDRNFISNKIRLIGYEAIK